MAEVLEMIGCAFYKPCQLRPDAGLKLTPGQMNDHKSRAEYLPKSQKINLPVAIFKTWTALPITSACLALGSLGHEASVIRQLLAGRNVPEFLKKALRFRNYAEELRIIAADTSSEESQQTF